MKILLTLVLVLVLIGVVLGGGVWYFLNTGKQVGTEWSEEDFYTCMEKSQVEFDHIETINLETLAKGEYTAAGSNEVDTYFTSEEMSALSSMANAGGAVRDVQKSLGDNGAGEISFRLSDNAVDFVRQNIPPESIPDGAVGEIINVINNKPIYSSGRLTQASENSINIDLDDMYLGRAPLPDDIVSIVEVEVEGVFNSVITPDNGFHIDELQINDGKLHYKGTLPETIEERISD